MSEIDEIWVQMRTLLEGMKAIAESLSEEDGREIESLMESWMQDNELI